MIGGTRGPQTGYGSSIRVINSSVVKKERPEAASLLASQWAPVFFLKPRLPVHQCTGYHSSIQLVTSIHSFSSTIGTLRVPRHAKTNGDPQQQRGQQKNSQPTGSQMHEESTWDRNCPLVSFNHCVYKRHLYLSPGCLICINMWYIWLPKIVVNIVPVTPNNTG